MRSKTKKKIIGYKHFLEYRNNSAQLERIPDTLTQRLQTFLQQFSFTIYKSIYLLVYYIIGIAEIVTYARDAIARDLPAKPGSRYMHRGCTASSLWLHRCVSALHNHRPLAETQLVLLRRRYGKYVSRVPFDTHRSSTWYLRGAATGLHSYRMKDYKKTAIFIKIFISCDNITCNLYLK